MNYDVTQWLNEIESLQQQLAEMRQERAEAESTAEHWRQLYNTEAQQRRDEAQAAQAEIERLQAQLQQQQVRPELSESNLLDAAQQEVESLPVDMLRSRSLDLTVECARLRQEVAQLSDALQTERENHAKTRTELTTALGDTVELLAKSKVKDKDRSPLIPQFLSENPEGEAPQSPEITSIEGVQTPKQIPPGSVRPLQLPASDTMP
ncbi:MAG TPA: hypothetical protein IGS17_11725 [Oscillatoriales cyanobacterium M59_W2019_021]|nr:hypothetical protein [Oscillatoriales cyanobacterium M4454_W2019_049]HIK51574.1 hypothetical protein [Oscillatoriales cyanobacterium M59_W2019_021]